MAMNNRQSNEMRAKRQFIEHSTDIAAKLYRVQRAFNELNGMPLSKLGKLADRLAKRGLTQTQLSMTVNLLEMIAVDLGHIGETERAIEVQNRVRGITIVD